MADNAFAPLEQACLNDRPSKTGPVDLSATADQQGDCSDDSGGGGDSAGGFDTASGGDWS